MLPRDTTIATFQSGQPVLASLEDIAAAIGLPTAEQIQFISSAASSAIDRIEALGDDGIISIDEKAKRLPALERELESLWAMLEQRAGDLSADGDVTATLALAAASRAGWQAYRDALEPPLSQTDIDTPIDRTVFDARLGDYQLALSRLADALRIAASRTSTWSGTVDDDGNRPEDGATVGAPAGTKVGDRPVEELLQDVADFQVQIADLVEIYGDTVSAAASADAAATYAAAAQTAKNDSQAAATASEGARDTAIAQAAAASGSATAAAGSASTASSKADQAAGSATAAAGSATAANTSAGSASVSAGNAATSATNASGSASSAATSAGTAATARDQAQTAATNAGSSATAAATSATNAAASQSAAAGSASSASTSATNAATSAGQASTSAGQASTSATNAAGSASAAATSATVSATARDAARLASQSVVPDNFTDPNNWFWDTTWGSGASVNGNLGHTTLGAAIQATAYTPISANKTYQVTCRFRVINQGGGLTFLGVAAYDASLSKLGYVWSTYQNVASPTLAAWVTGTGTVTRNDILAVFPTANFVRQVALIGYNGVSDGEILQLRLEDITGSTNAAGSATAAATSASSASTSAGNAGLSATAANTSATNASTSAGNASTSATNAASSASSASSSAAAALLSQQLAASIGYQSIISNPTFADWTGTYPTSWNLYGSGAPTYVQKVTGLSPNPNAIQFDTTSGATSTGIYQQLNTIKYGQYIAEIDIEVVSGSLNGVGVLWRGYTSVGGTNNSALDFPAWVNPDEQGITWGTSAPTSGRVIRYKIPIDLSAATSSPVGIFYFIADGYFNTSAKKLKLHRFVVRPTGALDSVNATLKTLSGAVADMYGRQSAFWQTQAAVAGSAATSFITVRADASTPQAAPLTPVIGPNGAIAGGGRDFYKTGSDNAWNDGFISNESYAGGAWVQGNATSANGHKMIGLTDMAVVGASYDWGNMDYGFYFQPGTIYDLRESGAYVAGSSGAYDPNIPAGVMYTNDAGGTISYWYGGIELTSFRKTGVGTGRTFRAFGTIYNIGGTAGLSNVVFGPTAPSTTSSVAIGAQEIALVNTVGTTAKIALKLANGDAAFSGNIFAGGKIIMGNGNTGWEVAVKPKILQVTDGQSVSWSNLGYTPSYSISPIGLAPLGTGETYNLYLDNLSSTGATARLKINVPGTPANYSLTVDAAGGVGDPARVMSKGGNPDATGGQYRYVGTWSFTGDAYREGPGQWWLDYDISIPLYAKVGGTWTSVGYYSESGTYGYSTGGTKTITGGFDSTVTAPASVTDFGSGGTDLTQVSWTSPGTGSSVRSASPSGQTCQLTITA